MRAIEIKDADREVLRPPLDSRQLRAFVTLARTSGFTAAGRELSLSQSAVCHSLKALEEDVGCLLFARIGKRVCLTKAGEQLLQYAQRILREMSEARGALQQLAKSELGRLRIGATTAACTYLLPSVFHRFKERFSEYAISMVPAEAGEELNSVLAGHVDVALTTETKTVDKVVFEPLFEDELAFIVSPQHSWARSRAVDRTEIAKQNYILYHRTSPTFRLVDDYFRREGVVLNTYMELDSKEAIKELLKLDMGVSILAPWTARAELAAGTLHALPMGRRKLRRHWGILRWRDRPLAGAERQFVDLCREVAVRLIREAGRWIGAAPAGSPRPDR